MAKRLVICATVPLHRAVTKYVPIFHLFSGHVTAPCVGLPSATWGDRSDGGQSRTHHLLCLFCCVCCVRCGGHTRWRRGFEGVDVAGPDEWMAHHSTYFPPLLHHLHTTYCTCDGGVRPPGRVVNFPFAKQCTWPQGWPVAPLRPRFIAAKNSNNVQERTRRLAAATGPARRYAGGLMRFLQLSGHGIVGIVCMRSALQVTPSVYRFVLLADLVRSNFLCCLVLPFRETTGGPGTPRRIHCFHRHTPVGGLVG